jgi:hypothetical protein
MNVAMYLLSLVVVMQFAAALWLQRTAQKAQQPAHPCTMLPIGLWNRALRGISQPFCIVGMIAT